MAQEATKIFSKPLTETDVKKRLAIPAKILPAMPDFSGNHAVNIRLVYGNGTRMWPIACSIRKTGYKKPVFSCGWKNFVIGNGLEHKVGHLLTLYKVQNGVGSFYYRIEVEKPVRPFAAPSHPSARSLNYHDQNGNIGTNIRNFRHEQEQEQEQLLPQAPADAPIIKKEGAIVEFSDVVADVAPTPFVFDVVGTDVYDESTRRAQFKTEPKTEMLLGTTNIVRMGEARLHGFCTTTKEESDIIKPFDLNLREVNLDLSLALPSVDEETL